MPKKRLKDRLKDKSGFAVIVELTSGPDFSFAPIDGFLKSYKNAKSDFLPEGFDFVGITSTDNSGGTPNLEALDVLYHLRSNGLLGDLDFIPHISCKDRNSDTLVSSLAGFKAADIEAFLVITGDKPVKGKGVFELESVNFLQMIKQTNANEYLKTSLDKLNSVYQFFPGAGVSPFKYTEPSQMQQYYKMEKKIASGAKFLITQLGWDWKKSVELFQYLEENNIDIPVIGNVFFLSTTNPAPRLMHDLKLPGCFVSDEFLAKLSSESFDEHIERCAQQVAMYTSIGAAGVDIGSVHDFDVFTRIIQRASEIGESWEQYKDNLHWPRENGFYLYDESGQRVSLSKPKKKIKHKFFDFMHNHFFEPESLGFRTSGKILASLGAKKNKGFVYNSFAAFEYAFKHALFECEMCGDCYLPENFSLCTIGGCEKDLSNAPCGDATVDGFCGNNLDIVCIGERIYNAAASVPDGTEKLRKLINEPRIHSLENTSSILNHWFERDHNAATPFISVGELIHSSVTKTGKIMQLLHESGNDAYTVQSRPLEFVKAMIESQAAEGADYIAVNLDALAKDNPDQAADMMIQYVPMIQRWANSVPICIDSDNNKVLIEGLKKWYETGSEVRPPLLSTIKLEKMDGILAMRKSYDFSVAVLLKDNEQSHSNDGKSSIENLYVSAQQIFKKAVGDYGFKPEQIFFELEVCPMVSDLQNEDSMPGITYTVFETAKKIMNDKNMAGVHCIMRPAIVARKLKRSIGVLRAYVSRAFDYGFDAAFLNVTMRYGKVEPDPGLLKFVDAFAKMDGSAEHKEIAAAQIKNYVKE